MFKIKSLKIESNKKNGILVENSRKQRIQRIRVISLSLGVGGTIQVETRLLFSVKSAYLVLRQLVADEMFILEEETCLLPKVWKTWAPSKVALQNRLSTRLNLRRRGVIMDDGAAMCPLCGLGSESAGHLFISCNKISHVWYTILCWLGAEWVSPRGTLGSFEVFLGMGLGRKNRLGWLLIW
jgi:hypothetical protein